MSADRENCERIENFIDRWDELAERGNRLGAEEFLDQEVRDGELNESERALLREKIEELIAADKALHVFSTMADPRRNDSATNAGQNQGGDDVFARLVSGEEIVPGYRLEHRIARGGFGEVWKGTGNAGFPVALKLISLKSRGLPVEMASFDIFKKIQHSHILTIFDVWKNDDFLIIAMQLADESLMDRFKAAQACGRSGLTSNELLPFFAEIAKALDFLNVPKPAAVAKRDPIQHGDVKPQNILISGTSALLGDLGLARVIRLSGSTPHSGSFTALFAAPECLDGTFSHVSDQYSLAATWYFLRSGQVPFDAPPFGVAPGAGTELPQAGDLGPSEHKALAKALARDPFQRYISSEKFVNTLRSAVRFDVRRKTWGRFVRAAVLTFFAGMVAVALWFAIFWLWPWYEKRHERAGDQAFSQQSYPTAVNEYGQALKTEPENAELLIRHAESILAAQSLDAAQTADTTQAADAAQSADAAINDGLLAKAAADLEHARTLLPDSARVEFLLAQVSLARRESQQALAHFERTVQLDPDHLEAAREAARLFLAQGDQAQALFYYNRAVELAPDDASLRIARAGLQQIPENALDDYAAALRLNPNEPTYYCQAARFLRDLGQYDAALVNALKALKLDPDNVEAEELCQAIIQESDRESAVSLVHEAITQGDARALQNCLDLGADASKKMDGTSALLRAVELNRLDMVNQLLAAGSDVEQANRQRVTPLLEAANSADLEIVLALLAAGADPNRHGLGESTPLHEAAIFGRTAIAKALIAAGADPNAKNERGETPLHMAAAFGFTKEIGLLIKTGAKINALDDNHGTPLYSAVMENQPAAVKELLAAGCDTEIETLGGQTPLMEAAYYSGTPIVQALLDAGADPGRIDSNGNTALHLAAMYIRETNVRALLDAGADPNIRNKQGDTVLHSAMTGHPIDFRNGTPDIDEIWALDDTPSEKYNDLPDYGVMLLRRSRIIQILIEKGADRGLKDHNGVTPKE